MCPPEGMLKINVDATFDINEGRGSSGVVSRDYRGKFVAAACTTIPFVSDATMAHLGLSKFAIEYDNMRFIETMKEGGYSAIAAAAVYYDCNILAFGFASIFYIHRSRDCNEVAHLLARNSFTQF